MRATVLALTTMVVTACHTYTPVESRAVAPGERVRFVVATADVPDLAEISATEESVSTVEGRVDRWEGSQLLLRVDADVGSGVGSVDAFQQLIRVPASEILSLERRQTDSWATAGLVAGAVGLATGVVLAIMEAWGGGSEGPGDDVVLFSRSAG